MREHRFLYDFPDVADCEGSCVGGGGPPCLLHAGLCCPDDPLETIMDNPDVFSDDLLEDLFIAAALPPPHRGWLPITIGGGGERVVDVDGADVGYRDRGGASSDDGAPRLPPSDAMSADDSSWTTSSVATKSPPSSRLPAHAAMSDSSWTPSSLETESPPPPPPRMPVHAAALSDSSWAPSSLETESSPPSVSRLVVPRKKRDSSVKRGKRLWSLDIPNVPASSDNPSGRDDGDQDGRRNIIHGGGGGVRQRLLIARPPRNSRTQRACSHCASTETPQWRAGPDGPGTLCNACGIRYKMNKLLPEYRPSTSPSFRSDKHSNRHRKVVKLREKVKVEKIVNMPLAPADCGGDFMDVCKYISTG
uniref:GATA-type domain-containing protein n=1 Tax=Setaria viridis TaxID=4556 RepID=A0A4U6W961_SETVI|nr:GATA transcription factor 2-like [Setaria viridis]TKW38264.1 hypothetical protein SEVIR_1G102800v2 [Setaria viridis]